MGRVVNKVALPPLRTETGPGKKTSVPLARWRQEIDLGMKSKAFRKDMSTEVLLPVKHCG
jgi:hypothetical protein